MGLGLMLFILVLVLEIRILKGTKNEHEDEDDDDLSILMSRHKDEVSYEDLAPLRPDIRNLTPETYNNDRYI